MGGGRGGVKGEEFLTLPLNFLGGSFLRNREKGIHCLINATFARPAFRIVGAWNFKHVGWDSISLHICKLNLWISDLQAHTALPKMEREFFSLVVLGNGMEIYFPLSPSHSTRYGSIGERKETLHPFLSSLIVRTWLSFRPFIQRTPAKIKKRSAKMLD